MGSTSIIARSSVEQLIGDRTIGMIIIDEAHIVTTLGKQFRPDFWYLEEHIRKLRSNQLQKKRKIFCYRNIYRTAIYHGVEDMSTVLGVLETLDVLSLEMTGGADSQLYICISLI